MSASPRHAALEASSILVLLLCIAVLCQPIHLPRPSPHQEKPHEALCPPSSHTSRTLTPEELKQRRIEIAAWAKEGARTWGFTLDPRSPRRNGSDLLHRRKQGRLPQWVKRSHTLPTIVFFDSSSRDQAIDTRAKAPGPARYGVTVEVREWTSPDRLWSARLRPDHNCKPITLFRGGASAMRRSTK